MTVLTALSSTLVHEIPTLLYTSTPKRGPLSGEASPSREDDHPLLSPYSPLYGVPPPRHLSNLPLPLQGLLHEIKFRNYPMKKDNKHYQGAFTLHQEPITPRNGWNRI